MTPPTIFTLSFLAIIIVQSHAQIKPKVECPSGSAPLLSDLQTCSECKAGTISIDGLYCKPCPEGTYSKQGSTECIECEPGTYAWRPGHSQCYPCGKGRYTSTGINCYSCPAGTFSDKEQMATVEECIPCEEGTISRDGAKSCDKCFIGEYSADGRFCDKCPRGTYSNMETYKCMPCPPGTYNQTVGASYCSFCPAGTYSFYGFSCNPCPAGTYSGEGAKNINECLPCDSGEFSKPNSTFCEPCRPGTYSVDRLYCMYCPAGTTSEWNSIICSACADGSVAGTSGSEKCTECPEGSFSVGGIYCSSENLSK